jgi:4a-hydroxytetrahydrobiopterin dehydratase
VDRSALSHNEIKSRLAGLEGWSLRDNALHRDFEFSDFRAAISFLVRLSFYAEALDHHPEIWNVYNRVSLKLTTHDAGNMVTEFDLKLAQDINDFSWV